MAPGDSAQYYSPEPNILERRASGYLKRLNAHAPPERERHPDEVAALRSTERWAVAWAALAGILSGGIIGGGEAYVRMVLIGDQDAGWLEYWEYWLPFLAFAGIISAIEIAFLYWNALHAIAKSTEIAGVDLGEREHSEVIARGLARTGLEFPNPRGEIYGIDPYANVPNWRLTAENLLYKLKVGVSSFLMRLFLRRVVGRMMVRGLIPLMAGPLYAVWNAIITWRIVREARVRALGPFAVENLVAEIESQDKELSEHARNIMLHGVGEVMMRGRDAHPNYVVLLARLRQALGVEDDRIDVDWDKTRRSLQKLDEEEHMTVLSVLTLAALVGNKPRRSQTELLREAYSDCGQTFQENVFAQLRTRLIEGQAITLDDLKKVGISMSEAGSQQAAA